MSNKKRIVVIGDFGPVAIGNDHGQRVLEDVKARINQHPDAAKIMKNAQKAGDDNKPESSLH